MALIDDIRKQYPDATSGKTDLDVASDFAKANGWSLEQTAYKMGVELPNDPGFLTTVKRSGAQFAGGIGEVYGDVTGNRGNALSSWAGNVAARNPSGINSMQDIADNPWLAAKEAVGNAATFVVPGGALKLGANALRGAKAVNAARMLDNPLTQAAVAGVPSLQEIGDSQRESGLGENRGLKYLGAGAVGAIENLGGVQRVLGYGGQNTARTIAQEVADFGKTPWRTVGKTMLRQGAEEGAEELVQTPIEQLAGYKNPTDARNLEETALGGAMGAIGGGVFGGGFGVQRGLKHRKIEQFRQADLLAQDAPISTISEQAQWDRAFLDRDGQDGSAWFDQRMNSVNQQRLGQAVRNEFAAGLERAALEDANMQGPVQTPIDQLLSERRRELNAASAAATPGYTPDMFGAAPYSIVNQQLPETNRQDFTFDDLKYQTPETVLRLLDGSSENAKRAIWDTVSNENPQLARDVELMVQGRQAELYNQMSPSNRRQGVLNFDAPALPPVPPVMFGNQNQPYAESFNNNRAGKFDRELNTKATPSPMTGAFTQLPVGDSAELNTMLPESVRLNELVAYPKFPMPVDVGSAIATVNQARAQNTPILEGSDQHAALVRAGEILAAAGVTQKNATKSKQVAAKAPQANAAQAGTQQAAAPAGKVTTDSESGGKSPLVLFGEKYGVKKANKAIVSFLNELDTALNAEQISATEHEQFSAKLADAWKQKSKDARVAHNRVAKEYAALLAGRAKPVNIHKVASGESAESELAFVSRLLGELTEDQRRVLELYHFDKQTFEDIGETLADDKGRTTPYTKQRVEQIHAGAVRHIKQAAAKLGVPGERIDEYFGSEHNSLPGGADVQTVSAAEAAQSGAAMHTPGVNGAQLQDSEDDAKRELKHEINGETIVDDETGESTVYGELDDFSDAYGVFDGETTDPQSGTSEASYDHVYDEYAGYNLDSTPDGEAITREDVAEAMQEWENQDGSELDEHLVPAWVNLHVLMKRGVVKMRQYGEYYAAISSDNQILSEGKGSNGQSLGLAKDAGTEKVSGVPETGSEGGGVRKSRSEERQGQPVTDEATGRGDSTAEDQPAARDGGDAESTQSAELTPARIEAEWNRAANALNLPAFSGLTDEQQDYLHSSADMAEFNEAANEVAAEVAAELASVEAQPEFEVEQRPDFALEAQPWQTDSAPEQEAEPAVPEANPNQGSLDFTKETAEEVYRREQDAARPAASNALSKFVRNAKTAREVAQWFAKNADSSILRMVVRRVLPLIPEHIKLRVVTASVNVPGGVPRSLYGAHASVLQDYAKRDGTMYIKDESFTDHGMTEETVAHELLHAALMARIKFGNYTKNADTDVGKAVGELYDLFNRVVRDFNARQKSGETIDPNVRAALANPDELVSWGMTNSVVQDFLKTVKYDGQTTWSRFVQFVRKILGLTKYEGTALDHLIGVTDNLVTAKDLVQGLKGTGHMFQVSTGAFSKVGQVVDELLAGRTGALKEFKLGWLTLEQIVEGSKNLGEKVTTALTNYSATMTRMQQTSKDIVYRAALIDQKWNDLSKSSAERLSKIMQDATLESFDPATQEPTTDKQRSIKAAYAALTSQGKEGAAAKAIYQESRDFFESLWHKRAALMRDAAVKAKLGGKELSEIDAMYGKRKGPYFPLVRTGKYYAVGMSQQVADLVEKKDRGELTSSESTLLDKLRKDPNHYITEAFASEREALVRSREYKAKLGVGYSNLQAAKLNMAAVQIPGFAQMEAYLKDSVEDAGIREDLSNMFAQMMFDMAGEHSALKRAMKREGVAGANPDMRQAIATTAQSQAHYIGRLENSTQMAADLMDIKNLSDKGNADVRRVYNELIERTKLSYQMDPENKLVDHLTSASYFAHLGISPAFWLTNMTQVPMITAPWLGARYGFGKVPTALATAFVDAKAIIKTSIIDGSWQNELDWSQRFAAGSNEDKLFRTLLDRGILDVTMEHDLGAVARTGNPVGSVGARFEQMKKMANTPVRVTEYANRAITALAAYRLEMAKSNNHAAAVEMAAKAVSQTQLNYNALNAPRYMRSVMGSKQLARIIMQFRKYQQGMLWLVASNIKDAIGGSAEDRRVAQRFLAGLFTTTGVMAGSLGLPLVGSVGMLANVLAGVFGDADDPFDFEEWVRNFYHDALGKELGDVASKGALMALGLDISKRVGMADLANPIPFARAGNNGRETVGNVLSAVAGAPAGTIADTIDGIAALAGGDVVKAIEKATPLKLAHDLARTYRYGTDGMTDSKGNVVLPPDSFSPWDLALRASGFTPEKESTYFEANAAMQQAKQAAKDVRNTLLRDYAKAVISGEDTSDVSDKIAAFNERHPDKGVRIDHSTKLKSVQNLRRMASERNEAGLRTDRTSKPFLDRAAFATD